MLVLSYAPNGCLQDYLRNSTIDWATFCRMSSSVAGGLAHLHTEFAKIGTLQLLHMCVRRI
jgi:bone morphogenetic protein receptor type-2